MAYHNRLVVYNLLFRTAAQAVQRLAADPRFVGGQIGMVGVLHTAEARPNFSPPCALSRTGGGLDFVHERWHATHNRFFVHVKPLSILFCAKMLEGLKAGLFHHVPSTAWRKRGWSTASLSAMGKKPLRIWPITSSASASQTSAYRQARKRRGHLLV
ncbi:MAG: transposase [Caldilineaceae bacterium]